LAAALVWALTFTWISRAPVRTRSPFDNTRIAYYGVSEYQPEIDTGSAPAKKARKGEPKLAKQRIISLPPAPDNFRQTIVTPNHIKLPADVALPNLVAWTPVPSAVPEAAMTRSTAQLATPSLPVAVISPPPETQALSKLPALPLPEVIAPSPSTESVRSRLSASSVPAADVVPPSPSTENATSRLRMPNFPQPAVIPPPVSMAEARRPLGAMQVGHLDPVVSAPKLPVSEQRAVNAGPQTGSSGSAGGAPAAAVPAAPVVTGLDDGKRVAAQLIALGINPSAMVGHIPVPAGSRSGEFAATPDGRPDAAGTPEIKGGGVGTGGNGPHPNGNGAPPGISVGPAPAQPAMVASAVPSPPAVRSAFRAALAATRATETLRTRPSSSVTEPAIIEDKVFAGKKYYSMILNMPNLTSSSGSWVIRFAELNESPARAELIAPIATLKVDPAYPAELIRDGVEGTVTLYAVIHRDGSVGEVRVLRGVEERLDQNARLALSRWIFRPGTKNGAAVDLEAVVQIPFHVRKFPF
jgi:TonB family protein